MKITGNVIIPLFALGILILCVQYFAPALGQGYLPPLKQMQNGVLPEDITCQTSFHLIFKSSDSSPICVKQATQAMLIERGWAKNSWSPIQTDMSLVKIKLERTPCFGACPIYSVAIDGNGNVNYTGIRFVQTNGTKTYEVPAEEVKKLVTLAYQIKFFSLNDRYEVHVTDLPSAITTITIGNTTKSVYDYGNSGPQALQSLEQKIDEISNTINLVRNSSEQQPASISDVVNLDNKFAFDMFSNIGEVNQENAFFSPFSISNAFAILYEGARGSTQDEIGSVFHFVKDDQERRNYTHTIISDINRPSQNYILSTANALWIQDDFPISQEYKDIANSYYLANTENLDFKTHAEESRNTVNNWIENKTNHKILDLLPEGSINDLTRAVITNAVYFLGNWTLQFDEKMTKQQNFTTSYNQTIQVPMMNANKNFNYTTTSNLQILEMSYKGDDLSMLVLLPKNNDLETMEKQLSVENLNQWRSQLTNKEVTVYIPKFKLETTYSLAGNLANMGMSSSFDVNSADFTGIDGRKDLYVTGVFHKAFVSVDERGTEAAAATGIVIGATSMPISQEIFKVDHPFIFLIQDKKTGLILFMGKVIDPTKES